MKVFVIALPIMSLVVVYCAHSFFQIDVLMAALAIPLVFVFTIIAVNSTGLTSITPLGALGKLTQLSFSVLAPNNIQTNIMTAGITGEVAGNAANLLMDIKPGYMLGAKPRHQAIGHVLGIFAGALVSVPVFYLIFREDVSLLASEKFPMPAAQIWRAVAEVLTKGLSFLHPTARLAIGVGAFLGVVFEYLDQRMKGKFPISGVGMGLAFVLPFPDIFAMGLGSILFNHARKRFTVKETWAYRVFVENGETLCAGLIAGGAIIGILLILLETMFL